MKTSTLIAPVSVRPRPILYAFEIISGACAHSIVQAGAENDMSLFLLVRSIEFLDFLVAWSYLAADHREQFRSPIERI